MPSPFKAQRKRGRPTAAPLPFDSLASGRKALDTRQGRDWHPSCGCHEPPPRLRRLPLPGAFTTSSQPSGTFGCTPISSTQPPRSTSPSFRRSSSLPTGSSSSPITMGTDRLRPPPLSIFSLRMNPRTSTEPSFSESPPPSSASASSGLTLRTTSLVYSQMAKNSLADHSPRPPEFTRNAAFFTESMRAFGKAASATSIDGEAARAASLEEYDEGPFGGFRR